MVKLGIAGIGAIAENYIALIADGRVEGVELTALCSRNGEHARQTASKYHLPVAVFTDYSAFLESGVADAVLIATPHGQHPSMTRQALERGLHVLVEKPVGIFADEVEGILAVLNQHRELVCGVQYNRRAARAFRYVRELVHGGRIGELVRATWVITNLYRPAAYYEKGSWRGTWQGEGGGILMTQASHQLDLMQWICGVPSTVWARCSTVGREIQVENEAELLFTYTNGARGHFIASAHECPGTNLLEICGTRGKVSVLDDSEVRVFCLEEDEREFARTCTNPFEKVPGMAWKRVFHDSDNGVQQAATIRNFARAVAGQESVWCSLEEGIHSLRIIHGAYLSAWKRSEVPLPVDEGEFRGWMEGLGTR